MPAITFTYTGSQGNRLAAYYGYLLGLGRDATAAEIKQEMWNAQRIAVAEYEKRKNEAAAIAAVTPPPDLGQPT